MMDILDYDLDDDWIEPSMFYEPSLDETCGPYLNSHLIKRYSLESPIKGSSNGSKFLNINYTACEINSQDVGSSPLVANSNPKPYIDTLLAHSSSSPSLLSMKSPPSSPSELTSKTKVKRKRRKKTRLRASR